jgi:hypothetical protein
MFLLFITALAATLARGISLPNCGCFGFGWHPTPLQTIILDSFLLACSLLAFKHGGLLLSLDNWRGASYTDRHA